MAQKNLPFLLDSLYCEEQQNWEEEEEEYDIITPQPKQLLEQDVSWEEEELSSLLSKEQENHQSPVCKTLEQNPSLAGARNGAVEWILKVNAYFSFSALTAVLAVNYFDRFFLRFHFQREKPWMSQLAAVACLSLAAKVEETQVPLLLDLQGSCRTGIHYMAWCTIWTVQSIFDGPDCALQSCMYGTSALEDPQLHIGYTHVLAVEETRYVFEAKTIQRMEILVLSTLQWRMNPVTPLSFVDYILRRLGLMNHPCWEFLIRCESLILCTISDFRFTNYLPSVLGTAIMLHVINTVEPCMAVDYHNQILATLGIDKEKVEECYKQILKSTSDFCYQARKRKFWSIPGSPNGVMDVCFSSDSSNDSWAAVASVSSSPEPLSKRIKGAPDHQHC